MEWRDPIESPKAADRGGGLAAASFDVVVLAWLHGALAVLLGITAALVLIAPPLLRRRDIGV